MKTTATTEERQPVDLSKATIAKILTPEIVEPDQEAAFGTELTALGNDGDLLLDMSQVELITSGAVGKLIRKARSLNENGHSLSLTNVSPEIAEVFRMTHLDKMIPLVDGTFQSTVDKL